MIPASEQVNPLDPQPGQRLTPAGQPGSGPRRGNGCGGRKANVPGEVGIGESGGVLVVIKQPAQVLITLAYGVGSRQDTGVAADQVMHR